MYTVHINGEQLLAEDKGTTHLVSESDLYSMSQGPIQRYSQYLDLEVKSQDSRGGDRAGRRGKADTHLAPTGQGREPLNPVQSRGCQF